MQCNITLRQFLQIFSKCRFTKRFWLFSTVFVDNFVENARGNQPAPLDKVYKSQNIDKYRENFTLKNQPLMNAIRGEHSELPVISAAKNFVYKSLPAK